jgi:hypothetical protein
MLKLILNEQLMENEKIKSTTDDAPELSPDEKKQLQIDIKYFFVNYPPKELRGIIWELYKGWAINSAEGASKEDITDMILFYDACRTFMEDVYITVTQGGG